MSMFRLLIILSLAISISDIQSHSALASSALRKGILETCELVIRTPIQRSAWRSYSNTPYSVPTYDDAFKDIMMEDKARNSFFSAAIGEPIASSVLLGLVSHNKISNEQVSIDSVGDFLKRYQPVLERYLEDKTKQDHDFKKQKNSGSVTDKDLDIHTLIDELAIKFYKPLSLLFPSYDKKSILDFACKLESGDMILVETQVRPQDYWDRRALAYAARRYSGQLLEGEVWAKLKKVYSINILGGYELSPSGEKRYSWEKQQKKTHGEKTSPSFIKRYELTNRYDFSQRIPHLQIIQLYPQLFDRKSANVSFLKEQQKEESILVLEEWLEFFKDAHKRTESDVERNVKDEGVKMAYSILKKHEPTEQYKNWRETYGRKYDEQMVQETAAAKEEGRKEEKINFARILKKEGMSDEFIFKTTGLSLDEISLLEIE